MLFRRGVRWSLPLVMGLTIGLSLLLAGSAPMATEQTAGTAVLKAPVWKRWYEWAYRWESPRGSGTYVWSLDREEIVDGVEFYVISSGRETEAFWRKSDLAFYMDKVGGAVETRMVPPQIRYVWPLAVGKRWEQTYTQEKPRGRWLTVERKTECQVEADETITVPAGTFPTIKIVCRNKGTGAVEVETWYSPHVQNWIRERGRFPDGIRQRELTAYTFKRKPVVLTGDRWMGVSTGGDKKKCARFAFNIGIKDGTIEGEATTEPWGTVVWEVRGSVSPAGNVSMTTETKDSRVRRSYAYWRGQLTDTMLKIAQFQSLHCRPPRSATLLFGF